MSLVGSLFNFKINNCCFFGGKKKSEKPNEYENIYQRAKQGKIVVLPVKQDFRVDSIFPVGNHVAENVSLILVGLHREYVHVKLTEPLNFRSSEDVLNHTDCGAMPKEFKSFLDAVFDLTFTGKNLQMMVMYQGAVLYCMGFPLYGDDSKKIVGSLVLLTDFTSVVEKNGVNTCRLSVDSERRVGLTDALQGLPPCGNIQKSSLFQPTTKAQS